MSTARILQAPPEIVNQYLSQLSDEELAQLRLLPQKPQGAPADFGGAVFPNPDNVRVSDDTESGLEPTRLSAGATFQRDNFAGAMPADVSNPAQAQILPTGAKSTPAPAFDPNAGYEKEASGSAPAFNPDAQYEAAPAEQTEEGEKKPGWLDRELPPDQDGPMLVQVAPGVFVPLYKNATLSGVQSIGRGVRDAIKGTIDLFSKPETADEKAAMALGPGLLPAYRVLRGLGHTAADSTQALAAIRDINASPDPIGAYAKAAQETAGQGAGQALVALAGEGLVRGVPPAAKATARTAERVTEKLRKITPKQAAQAVGGTSGAISGHGTLSAPGAYYGAKTAGRAAEIVLGKERANAPIFKPKLKATVEATTPAEDLEGISSPQTEAAAAAEPETIPAEVETASPKAETPAEVLNKRGTPAELEKLLNESLGGRPLEKGVPLRSQGMPKAPAASSLPEGFTPVKSSALRGYKYDPAAREFEYVTKDGQHYVRGDVGPEAMKAFDQRLADTGSYGKAWDALKKHPESGVGQFKVIDGKRMPVKGGAIANEAGEVIPKSQAGMQSEVGRKAERLGEFIRSEKPGPKSAKAQASAPASSGADVDLLSQLKQSLDAAKEAKGGIITSAEPEALMKRWGVDEESLRSGREQTRGMTADKVEAQIEQLVEQYKKGGAVEPILETRDAANNLVDVDGRMRVIAARRAGIQRIPIIVRRLAARK